MDTAADTRKRIESLYSKATAAPIAKAEYDTRNKTMKEPIFENLILRMPDRPPIFDYTVRFSVEDIAVRATTPEEATDAAWEALKQAFLHMISIAAIDGPGLPGTGSWTETSRLLFTKTSTSKQNSQVSTGP